MRLLTLAAAALAALLLTIALANAQEPPEPQTATRLEPGINLVGWVGEPTSTSQLFDEIPQLEAIWAWDAELDDWIVAGRGAPEWLGGLGRVWAGMGLRLVLGGEAPFAWQRPTEPTSGLVKLRTGWNLVAWSGADGAPIEQVAKGIGWSLRELRRWDAANQRWATWTSPERSTQLIATSATDQGATGEESEPVPVRRGEALWVNVARSVNWLQPTDILPRLVFPGGASDALQARVREDLEAVLSFYGQQYGIQANPDFTVYVAKDAESLIQAQKDDGDEIDDAGAASIRAQWDRVGGWAGENVVVKQNSWPEDLPTSDIPRARYTLTHEYFHILQDQMSYGRPNAWLSEGTATWAEDSHRVIDGSLTWEDARERTLSAITKDTPTLRSTEFDNATWQYTLGWLATDRLTEAVGGGSYIEFWRRLAPTEIGSHHRWTSTPGWRAAFQETFRLPTSSFYADFDAWQQEQAAANGANANPTESDVRQIRGRVTRESGAPVAGVFVNAIRVEGEISVGWNQRAETGVDGTFAVRAPEDGDYRISVNVADDCTLYHNNDGLTEEWDEAQPLRVAGSDLRGVNIRLSSNSCRQIRGQVVDTDGEPLAGTSVIACREVNCAVRLVRTTDASGAFAITVPDEDAYRIQVGLDSCWIYFGTTGLTADWSQRLLVRVSDRDLQISPRQIPARMCAHRISGRLVDASGAPLTEMGFDAYPSSYGSTGANGSTDTNGRFEIIVPSDGAYRFIIYLRSEPFCRHDFKGHVFGSRENPVRVSGADVTGITLRLPGTIEELCR